MAGTETARFDLVMQFSEQAYQDLLGVFFDEGGLIGKIVDLIPGLSSTDFSLDFSLDRPSDVTLPGTATDVIDLRLRLGSATNPTSLRMVVGMTVDRTAPDRDTVLIDFKNKIFAASATLGGTNIPIPNLTTKLQNLIPSLPVLPVPVDRTATAPTKITRADFRIVDDTTPAERDATSAMLTFGGGAAGDAGSLRSIVPDGGRGAIGIFFPWLCRMAVPSLESSLELPAGSFDITDSRCSLNRSVAIGEDKDVSLTSLVLELKDGFISVTSKVTKSGFCYDASGTVGAKLLLEIKDGRLIAKAEVGDPDVDVDIPWYCYLAGAVIGAVLGGVLLGVIGAIVGGILVPLITHTVIGSVETTIDEVADRIRDAINQAIPSVDVPAFGVNILFQRVFIDDVKIQMDMKVESHAPIRCQGTVSLFPGQGIDLDNGQVGNAEFPAADMRLQGSGFRRVLAAGCQAGLARTDRTDFGTPRYALRGLNYQMRSAISVTELGIPNPLANLLGWLGDLIDINPRDEWFENQRICAIRTNEGRYSMVQVIQIEQEKVIVRYKTYETEQTSVRIEGNFKCESNWEIPQGVATVFEPAASLVAMAEALGPISAVTREQLASYEAEGSLNARIQTAIKGRVPVGTTTTASTTPTTTMAAYSATAPVSSMYSATSHASATAVLGGASGNIKTRDDFGRLVYALPPMRDGKWVSTIGIPQSPIARLKAVSAGTHGELKFVWKVGGEALADGSSGTIDVGDVPVGYEVSGANLVLSSKKLLPVELFVQVELIDHRGCSAKDARCIHFSGRCPKKVRRTPKFDDFIKVQVMSPGLIGIATTPPVIVDPQGPC